MVEDSFKLILSTFSFSHFNVKSRFLTNKNLPHYLLQQELQGHHSFCKTLWYFNVFMCIYIYTYINKPPKPNPNCLLRPDSVFGEKKKRKSKEV